MKIPMVAAMTLALQALAGAATVTVTDATDAGLQCFKVQTPAATWYLDKKGGGFSSIVDKNGNDWVGYANGGGSGGNYRGLPNFGPVGHPGAGTFEPADWYQSMTSTLQSSADTLVMIVASTASGGYRVKYEFFADRVRFTMEKAEADFWALYEGDPGGAFSPSSDFYYLSTGEKRMCDQDRDGADLPDPEWVFFGTARAVRGLLYIHHQADNISDTYWHFSDMTVFGFGRKHGEEFFGFSPASCPQTFTVALLETQTFSQIKSAADRVLAGGGTVGVAAAPRTRPSLARIVKTAAVAAPYRFFDLRGRPASAPVMPHPTAIRAGVYVRVCPLAGAMSFIVAVTED
jgi:hypothetical protein